MPISKRQKIISNTKVKAKGNDHKEALIQKVQEAIKNFEYTFIFSHENMTTVPFRTIQDQWNGSKFFLGKNKVMQVALGRTEEESFQMHTYKLSEHLQGDCGIFCTNEPIEKVQEFFEQFNAEEYARSGQIADQTIILKQGSEVFKKFSHSIEPYLRKLGVATSLKEGEIILTTDYLVAEQGKPLTAEQCKILKLLQKKLGSFKLHLQCYWKKSTKSYVEFKQK